MPFRRQHFVPEVYLKSWESLVSSINEPKKKFRGLYYYDKHDLSMGDGRNKKSILYFPHTYTINFNLFPYFHRRAEIVSDFCKQLQEILDRRNVTVFLDNHPINDIRELLSLDVLTHIDNWAFVDRECGEIRSNTRTVNEIKDIRSYVLEHQIDKYLEKRWESILTAFSSEIEIGLMQTSHAHEQIKVSQDVVCKLIDAMLLMLCRNPVFDYIGIFPSVKESYIKIISEYPHKEDEDSGIRRIMDEQMHALWLNEIYKGLFSNEFGFLTSFSKAIKNSCRLILFICPENNGSWLTSDNPAYIYYCNVTQTNRTGFYFPLSPKYLLAVGIGEPNSIDSIDVHITNNEGVRYYNRITLSMANEAIISKEKYLGFIL